MLRKGLSCTSMVLQRFRGFRKGTKLKLVKVVLQIKDEQGNFKDENFAELRHVGFGIKEQEGNVDGQPTITPPAARYEASVLL